mmetsp:Transcript_5179/g.11487  ORF Transcript_5179/g.11487 Transcript_5179/m.11487 type:complete len:787 (+) Transcript_5179:256-2616(+)
MASSIAAKMTQVFARSKSLLISRMEKESNRLILRSSIAIRHSSVFSRFMTEHNDNTLKSNVNKRNKEWHCPSFMSGSNIAEKEAWLESLLATTNTGNITNTTSTMNHRHQRGTLDDSPIDIEAFLVVLKALASADAVEDAGSARRGDMWMNRLLNLNARHLQPTSECYQYVIQAWANSNKEQAIVIRNRSQRWFNELVGKSGDDLLSSTILSTHDNTRTRQDFLKVEPTIECFNAFLDGLSRGRQGKSKREREILLENATMGESILRRLHSLYTHRSKQEGDNKNKTSRAVRAFECHSENAVIIRPNTDTFNYVIRGWTRCKHEAFMHEKVLAILRLMETYQRENPAAFIIDRDAPRPNTKSYAMAMDALITEAKRKARNYNHRRQRRGKITNFEDGNQEEIENTHLNGIDEINEAASILKYLHDLHDAGVEGVVPHRVPYNILITGWAALASISQDKYYHKIPNDNHGEEFKAEEILRAMISHRENGFLEASPDVVSYEKVMLAWANSGHPNAGKRAQWWLKQLWRDYDLYPESTSESSHKSSLLPTVNTYNIVMKALAWTDGALAAENVLLDLGEKHRDSTDHPGLCPNSESFAIVIKAWLESAKESRNVDERISSIRRAYEWLSSLRGIENENDLSTSPELFTGLLAMTKICAKQRPRVLDLAMQIFEDFRQSRHRLDYISYATLLQVGLQAHARGSGELRGIFVEKLFAECCNDGLVSNVFIRTLVDDPSIECKELVDRVLQDWPLPSYWSRNLKNSNNRCTPIDLKSSSERHSMRRRRNRN